MNTLIQTAMQALDDTASTVNLNCLMTEKALSTRSYKNQFITGETDDAIGAV
jgi:hypothetical protein